MKFMCMYYTVGSEVQRALVSKQFQWHTCSHTLALQLGQCSLEICSEIQAINVADLAAMVRVCGAPMYRFE